MILAHMNKKEDGTFTGLFRSATVTCPIAIAPARERKSEKSPSHGVFAHGVRIGAAWAGVSKAGREYLSVRIEDPAVQSPLHAALVATPTGHALVWGR
jgi:uncharacterized protein (DUF736 family)